MQQWTPVVVHGVVHFDSHADDNRERATDGSIGGLVEKERLETLSDLGNGVKREPELGRRAGREEKERERENGW